MYYDTKLWPQNKEAAHLKAASLIALFTKIIN